LLSLGADIAKTWVPFYSEYKLRNNVPGTGFFDGGLLGSNLQEQAAKLMSEPWEQFKEDYPRIIGQLEKNNPIIALQFANAMNGMSHSDVWLSNTFSLLDIATAPGVGMLSKALLSKAGIFNATRTAVRQQVEAAAYTSEFPKDGIIPPERSLVVTHNMPSTAIATESAGDVARAAVKRVT